MRHLIDTYSNPSGAHCGSTAMRNLLKHYCGLELSEQMVFGLGSGVDFLFVRQDLQQPSLLLFGRGLTMEVDLATTLGVDYREQPQLNDETAWQAVRSEVLKGRPTMLSGDALYLDYRDFKVHFPAHRFVLLGFDDEQEVAYIADRIDEETQACSYAALRASRNPPDFISTCNLWGKFHSTQAENSLEQAIEEALQRSVARMLGDDPLQLQLLQMLAAGRPFKAQVGLPGMRSFHDYLPSLEGHQDLSFVGAYLANTIEKFGTGGGNFRNLVAGFLSEVQAVLSGRIDQQAPELASRSAAAWTELASHFKAIADGEYEQPKKRLKACQQTMARIIELETSLFEGLAESCEPIAK